MAKVQIDYELFLELCKYHLAGLEEADRAKLIRQGLSKKLDRIAAHELYTESKVAETARSRESARQNYLDKIGIQKNFRWSAEKG